MPSFDIVSEINEVELKNAVDNAVREMGTRFDFRGVESSIELKELTVTLKSESDFQVRQLEDYFVIIAASVALMPQALTWKTNRYTAAKPFL